jgi:hypothetical protein
MAAVGGLSLATVSVFFDWATFGNVGAGPMDDNSRFRLGDWLSTDMIDGYVVLLLGVAGVVLAVVQLRGTLPPALRKYQQSLVPGIGGVLLAIAGLNIEYVTSSPGLSIGLGLYLFAAGSALAAASPFVPVRPLTGRAGSGVVARS